MKIGILQNTYIFGGRLSVVVEIIRLFNRRGIVPDLITFRSCTSSKDIKERYGAEVDFQLSPIKSLGCRIPGEGNILAFNLALHRLQRRYDYFIDSNNSSFLMPTKIPIFSYIHFPRIARLKSPLVDIHDPRRGQKKWASKEGALLKLFSMMYACHRPGPTNFIAANSRFTRSHIQAHYTNYRRRIPVIYPAVDRVFVKSGPMAVRENAVCSVGRFCHSKNQMGQIQLAERMPKWRFHLIGFSDGNNDYLNHCITYVRKKRLPNVIFHINATRSEKTTIMNQSKFFLHPNINEPFGIATVESVFAGSLPLVHNSGGQKEIVPVEKLRFDVLDEVAEFIQTFGNDNEYLKNIHNILVHHCRKRFEIPVFSQKMDTQLLAFESNYGIS